MQKLASFESLAKQNNWLNYSVIPDSDFLILVVRKLRDEFVVHLYNSESNGYFGGDYFKTHSEALNCFHTRFKKYHR